MKLEYTDFQKLSWHIAVPKKNFSMPNDVREEAMRYIEVAKERYKNSEADNPAYIATAAWREYQKNNKS